MHVDLLVGRYVGPTGVELEAVAAAVASRMHPVWTVCGPTGYGATSFAAALAARIKGDYSGDVGQPSPPFPGGMYVRPIVSMASTQSDTLQQSLIALCWNAW
jgi:hypothetical protein